MIFMRLNPMKFAILAAAAALAGCVSFLPAAPPPAARYVMTPATISAPAVKWRLIVDDPTATRVHDTTKIAIIHTGGRVDYFAGAEWADRAPRLIRFALVRSFENSGAIMGVGDRAAIALADFTLQTDIRALQGDFEDGGRAAEVEIFGRIVDKKGEVVAVRLFAKRQQAAANNADAIHAAFDQALQSVFADIVAWTFETGETAIQAK